MTAKRQRSNAMHWLHAADGFLFDRWRDLNRMERMGYKGLVQLGMSPEAGRFLPFARDELERVNALEASTKVADPEIRVERVFQTPVEQQLKVYGAAPPTTAAGVIRQRAFQLAHQKGLSTYVEIKLNEQGDLAPMHTLESVTDNCLAGFADTGAVEDNLTALELTMEEARANVVQSLVLRLVGHTTMDTMLHIVERRKMRGIYDEKAFLALGQNLWKQKESGLELDVATLRKMEQRIVTGAAMMLKSQEAARWKVGVSKFLIDNLSELTADLELPGGIDQMVGYIEPLQEEYPDMDQYYLKNTRRLAEMWGQAWMSSCKNDILARQNRADKA